MALPKSAKDLFSACEKAADALHTHESSIGVMHSTEALLRADLATARTANNQFQAAKSARLAATAAQDAADANPDNFRQAASRAIWRLELNRDAPIASITWYQKRRPGKLLCENLVWCVQSSLLP